MSSERTVRVGEFERAFTAALLAGDQIAAETTIREAMEAKLTSAQIDDGVIGPALWQIGELTRRSAADSRDRSCSRTRHRVRTTDSELLLDPHWAWLFSPLATARPLMPQLDRGLARVGEYLDCQSSCCETPTGWRRERRRADPANARTLRARR